MKCQNCGNKFEGNYCNFCGQNKAFNNRFTLKEVLNDTFSVFFNTDNKYLLTLKLFLIRPRNFIYQYLNGKRMLYTKPIRFFIVSLVIYTFLEQRINTGGGVFLSKDFNDYSNLFITFIELPLISLGSFFLFNKDNYNYAENIVVNLYIYTVLMYAISIFYIFEVISKVTIEGREIIPIAIKSSIIVLFFIRIFKDSFLQKILKSFFLIIMSYIVLTFLVLYFFKP